MQNRTRKEMESLKNRKIKRRFDEI